MKLENNSFLIVFISLVILLGTLSTAQAGIVIVSQQILSMPTAMQQTGRVYIDKDRMRIETSGGIADQIMIVRQDKGVMWIINPKAKTYTEMSKGDFHKVTDSLKGPPANQARKSHFEIQPTTYKKIASGEKIGSWTCDKYEGSVQGQKNQDIWTTPPASMGLDAGDVQNMKNLGDFFKDMGRSSSNTSPFDIGSQDSPDHYSGIPIKSIFYSHGQQRIQNEVREVNKQGIDPALFELPSGAQKQTMPF